MMIRKNKLYILTAAIASIAMLLGVFTIFNGRAADPKPQLASCDAANFTYKRPYSDNSPWNTPLVNPTYSPNNDAHINALKSAGQNGAAPLSSDPTQYTFPVYYVNNSTPKRTIKFDNWFSDAISDSKVDNYRISGFGGYVYSPTDTAGPQPSGSQIVSSYQGVPIPDNVAASPGSDAQVIIINSDTGEQWAMTFFSRDTKGTTSAADDVFVTGSLTRYNINFNGVPATPTTGFPNSGSWWQIGAGIPALAGLIRPCEMLQGQIDHALQFAYAYPAKNFDPITSSSTPTRGTCNPDTNRPDIENTQMVYPASGNDGSSCFPDVLEGTRLQLDPTIPDATIRSWTYTDPQNRTYSCTDACFIIAKALQKYGMYVIDQSGNPKVRAESSVTANWSSLPTNLQINANTVNPIPWSAFKVVEVGCSNGRDDDGDGKVDTADSGCTSANDFEEADSATPPSSCSAKQGDVNNDSKVDVFDLSIMLSAYGKPSSSCSDINKDGKVDLVDLSALLTSYGT